MAASNTASGSGTLVPGPPTARFELLNAGDGTFDVYTVAVTLVKAVTIDGVLAPAAIVLGSDSAYTATVSNRTSNTFSIVVLRTLYRAGLGLAGGGWPPSAQLRNRSDR